MDSDVLTDSNTYVYAHTEHSKITAKHTDVWTVSLTDQTHVLSLTFNLNSYDCSSSSSSSSGCSVWVGLILFYLDVYLFIK